MRQRMFHPAFWSSSRLNKLIRMHGPKEVLFYWGLVSNSDDEGRETCDIDSLDMRMPLLRLDSKFVLPILPIMHDMGLIQLYETQTRKFYFIPDWFAKQTIRKPYPSECPLPTQNAFKKYPDYFKALEVQYGIIIKRYKSENRPIPDSCLSHLKTIKGWFDAKTVVSTMPQESQIPILPLLREHSTNAKLFLKIIQEYTEWNIVPEKDCLWLEEKEKEFNDIDVAFHMEQWHDWIETQYRLKLANQKCKFPVNFKTSLHNRFKSARERNNNGKSKLGAAPKKIPPDNMETPEGY